MPQEIGEYASAHRRKKKWMKIVTCLAAVVVFCTTYALILPAITLERGQTLECSYTVHEHTEACYDSERNLICGFADYVVHTHDENCRDADGNLVCKLEEIKVHEHDDSCYEERQVLACGMEESEGHVHDESCISWVQGDLICGDESHEHTDDCYEWTAVNDCGMTEGEGAHHHTSECYQTEKTLICVEPEVILHTHTDDCYEEVRDENGNVIGRNLICGLLQTEEHVHTDECLVSTPEENNDGIMTADSEVTNYTPVEYFYLWLFVNPADGGAAQMVYGNSKWDNPQNGTPGGTEGITDALSYTEGNETYYLIPVSYFTEYYGNYGYSFDASDTGNCPVKYAPDAAASGNVTGIGRYVYVDSEKEEGVENSGWYIRVQDTGTYNNDDGTVGPPRSNIYFDESVFKLWLWLKEEDGTTSSEAINEQQIIHDFLTKTEDGETWYLIPVSYFEDTYKSYGYSFDENADDECPFLYAPDAAKPGDGLTEAQYTQQNGNWYVQVQDKGDYGNPPRSNIYYTCSAEPSLVESFYLYMYVKDDSNGDYKMSAQYAYETELNNIVLKSGIISPNYLIPVSYFIDAYGDYGYTFDPAHTESCPIKYLPDASNSGSFSEYLATASYVYVEDQADENTENSGWYVQVQDTGTYDNGVPRSNVYYVSLVKDAISPAGTSINLFDYWVTGRIEDDINTKDYNGGINANHALKFKPTGLSGANVWTESSNVYPGIVNRTLTNGYPTLTNQKIFGITDNGTLISGSEYADSEPTESLAYLFDPSYSGASSGFRSAYRNVSGLLQMDSNGYYYYDSQKNYAEFDEASNSFLLYNDWAVTYTNNANTTTKGQFFPFNAYDTLSRTANGSDSDMNHYFGMTLTARFIQQYGGHTDFQKQNKMVFEFSGDDDVWIFIDDVLVADLGGIHDAASVKVDFSTGDVTVNGDKTTNIRAAFGAADVSLPDSEWRGNTFADDTAHTLKFFYLERGSYASNLKLMYNLKEIPASSIVKVDQYGKSVSNAKFALYTAQKNIDGKYEYLLDPVEGETDPVYISLDGLSYTCAAEDTTDEDGNIITKKGTITITSGDYKDRTITPIYYGITDEEGNMTFVDGDGMNLALSDLKKMANGSIYFILREVVIPDGYRVISDEIWLYLKNNVLYCDNVYSSGAWAAASALLTATGNIYLSDNAMLVTDSEDPAEKTLNSELSKLNSEEEQTVNYDKETGKVTVTYYNPEKGESSVKGTLFAVVLKYSGNEEEDLEKQSSWKPLYGNGLEGYTLVDVESETRDGFIEAAIKTAKIMNNDDDYSDTVFTMGNGGAMQLLLSGLPGELETYYSMLLKSYDASSGKGLNKYLAENLSYSVGYYWTTADSLDEATAENTFRVDPYASEESNYSGFDRTFAASIEVPNLVNRLFVQKLDENGDLVNGAAFAMYRVGQNGGSQDFYYIANDDTHIYLDADTDGDNAGTARAETGGNDLKYKIGSDGVITVSNENGTDIYTISPVEVQITNGDTIAKEEGTAVFGHRSSDDGTTLESGYYIVREISAPDGYRVNAAEIQVLVDDTAVYANAGTTDDGVTVARGPGYVVSTLQKFASHGDINNTLTWVYEQLLVSGVTTSYAEVYNALNSNGTANWPYLMSYTGTGFSAKTETTDNANSALTTYLEYDADEGSEALFNYKVNTERPGGGAARRMYTSVGWSYYLLYQDTDYGKEHVRNGAEYTDLSEYSDISSLFSRSTYIQVADRYRQLTVTKVNGDSLEETKDENGKGTGKYTYDSLKGAEFTLAYTDGEGSTWYYQPSDPSFWRQVGEGEDIPVITVSEGTVNVRKLLNGSYILTEVKAPDGYKLLTSPITFEVTGNGAGGVSITGNNENVKVTTEGDKNIAVLLISNTESYTLPNTGGEGTTLFTIGGLLIMAGAVGCGYGLRRRRERRAVG